MAVGSASVGKIRETLIRQLQLSCPPPIHPLAEARFKELEPLVKNLPLGRTPAQRYSNCLVGATLYGPDLFEKVAVRLGFSEREDSAGRTWYNWRGDVLHYGFVGPGQMWCMCVWYLPNDSKYRYLK